VIALANVLSLDPDKLTAITLDSWQPADVELPQNPVWVESIFVPYGAYGENCYIFACSNTKKAAVVDPGGPAKEILQILDNKNLSLEMILITHAHGDHISGVKELISAIPDIKVIMNRFESGSLSDIRIAIEDNEQVLLGNLDISALHTPGHTPGSTCYYANSVCFSGDTLFSGSIGRPSNHQVYENMLSSIREKILSLPDETIICPGHGPMTTVAEEKAHNPFF
jgi:glyoxylase-like metal-dependent hydrolase (beta-lactamase superfamily II)